MSEENDTKKTRKTSNVEFFAKYTHPRWQKKRLERMEQAGWRCESCESDKKTLHVHHKSYKKGASPWEYENDELECLCEDCHAERHGIQEHSENTQPNSIFANKPKQPLFILACDLMINIKRQSWVMKGILERGSLNMIYGESSAGKSIIAIDWACCIAAGRDWHGHKVCEKGAVFYIAGEGRRGLQMRVQANSQKYNDTNINENLYFSNNSVDFLKLSDIDEIVQSIRDIVAITSVNPAVVLIDTLNRNMSGDENKADDVAKYLKGIEQISKEFDCAIVTVHHSGLADKGRARGSSALRAGHDSEWQVLKNSNHESTLSCTKAKDFTAPNAKKFELTCVPLEGDHWLDEDEERAVSVYFAYVGVDTGKEQKLSQRDEIALEALKLVIKEHPKKNHGAVGDCVALDAPPGIMMCTIEDYRKYFNTTCKGKNKSRDFDIALKQLETRRYIGKDGSYLWLIEE